MGWARRSRGTAQAPVLAVLGIVAVLSACGSSGASDRAATGAAGPIPVSNRPGDSSAAGAQIANGITVPAGSVMIGQPFGEATLYGAPPSVPTWTAFLEVPGDPRAFIADLRAQVRAKGLTLVASPHYDSAGHDLGSAYCFHDRLQPGHYDCAAQALPADGAAGVTLTVELHRSPPSAYEPAQSWAALQFSEVVASTTPDSQPTTPSDAPTPVPTSWVPLPLVGQRFGSGIRGHLQPLVVESHSRVLATPSSGFSSGCDGFGVLIALDGRLRTTVTAYVHQAEVIMGEAAHPPVGQLTAGGFAGPNGSTTMEFSVGDGDADDTSYDFSLIQRRGTEAELAVEGCHV